MIRDPKKSIWIATLALAASAQISPASAEAAEAERARRAEAELKHQAWQAQPPMPPPAQPQAMSFYYGAECTTRPSGMCPWLVAEGDITKVTPVLFEHG